MLEGCTLAMCCDRGLRGHRRISGGLVGSECPMPTSKPKPAGFKIFGLHRASGQTYERTIHVLPPPAHPSRRACVRRHVWRHALA